MQTITPVLILYTIVVFVIASVMSDVARYANKKSEDDKSYIGAAVFVLFFLLMVIVGACSAAATILQVSLK